MDETEAEKTSAALLSVGEPVSEKQRVSMATTETKTQKIVKTLCLVCVWICMGTYMEINGPTLKDLVYRTGESYESITWAVAGRSVGKFVGSVLGGFLIDRFGGFSDVIIACCLVLAAITVTCIPWVYSVNLLWFMYFALGVLLGTKNITGNRTLLCMWLEKSAAPMHILHCGYGIGGFLAPLIANPFLADFTTVSRNGSDIPLHGNQSIDGSYDVMGTSTPLITVTETIATTDSRIEISYGIVGSFAACMSLVFFFLQCYSGKQRRSQTDAIDKGKEVEIESKLTKKRSWKEMINPAVCAHGNLLFGLVILGMLFCRYFFYTGADRLLGTFTRSYAVDYLGFTKNSGSYVNTVYWIAYSAGRIVCFLLANFISVKILLLAESLGAAVTLLLMIFFCIPVQYSQSYWYLIFFTGFFVGPMFPSGMAWADLQVDMTGLAITWVMLGSAFGGLTFYNVGGHAYDHYGPTSFIYVVFILLCASFCSDIVLTVISVCCGRSGKSQYEVEEEMKVDKSNLVSAKSISFREDKV